MTRSARFAAPLPASDVAQAAVRWLARRGTARNREGMARYGISSPRTFGVSAAAMRPLVRRLGRSHEVALALWDTGWLEARLLAGWIDDPAAVTAAQMDRWCRTFDNWAICDSTCLHLFCRTPHAWRKAVQWTGRRPEFVRRAGFALIAALAVHDRAAPDERFLALLPRIETAARDPRPMVRKAVNWALRQVGKRSPALHAPALLLAVRLAAADDAGARWVGRDAERELRDPCVRARLARGRAARARR